MGDQPEAQPAADKPAADEPSADEPSADEPAAETEVRRRHARPRCLQTRPPSLLAVYNVPLGSAKLNAARLAGGGGGGVRPGAGVPEVEGDVCGNQQPDLAGAAGAPRAQVRRPHQRPAKPTLPQGGARD